MDTNNGIALYVYGPDGDEMLANISVNNTNHIPRIGERLAATDHSEEGAETVRFASGLRVTDVKTEFRLVEGRDPPPKPETVPQCTPAEMQQVVETFAAELEDSDE